MLSTTNRIIGVTNREAFLLRFGRQAVIVGARDEFMTTIIFLFVFFRLKK